MVTSGEQAVAHADRVEPPRAVHHLRRTANLGRKIQVIGELDID
jgi:hypothetical protein